MRNELEQGMMFTAGSQTRKQLLLSGKGEQVWGNILGSENYMICGQVKYEKSLYHEEIGCYYEGKPAGYLKRAPKGGIPVVDSWYCDSPSCRQKVMFVLT